MLIYKYAEYTYGKQEDNIKIYEYKKYTKKIIQI